VGIRGQRPKPKALRALQGSRERPHHRPEPAFAVGANPPPSLTDQERTYWDYYAPRLIRTGVLTEADREVLRLFCEALGQVDAIKAQQAELGGERLFVTTATDAKGKTVRRIQSNPLDGQRRAWTQLCRFYAQELGLSPSARARVATVGQEAAEDPLESFLRRVK
jgi:P27 family predicted phage terminase small subunit